MKQLFVHSLRAVMAASLVALAPLALAQNTIRIGMITDKVGPAKAYAEPVAQGMDE